MGAAGAKSRRASGFAGVSGPAAGGALLHPAHDDAVLVLHLEQAVAGRLAPVGHVLEQARIVADDLEELPGSELGDVARREEERERAEHAESVQGVIRLAHRFLSTIVPMRAARQTTPLSAVLCTAAFVACAFGLAGPAAAWSPRFQTDLALEAARLAPPDLARQIERHESAFAAGVAAPFADREPARHVANPDGSGSLEAVIAAETERAVEMIRTLAPFDSIVHQLGVVAHYVADAHNPLNASDADDHEARIYADYLEYAERAAPRFPLVFYGFRTRFEEPEDVGRLTRDAVAKSRELYPLIGREYRRIGFARGAATFDDRSTAFGVTSIQFSRAASDIAQVLRYIWLRAGGADPRSALPLRGGNQLVRIPRSSTGLPTGLGR